MVFHNRDAPIDDDLDADLSEFVPGWSTGNDPFNLDVDCPLPPDADLLQQFGNDLPEIPNLLDDASPYSADDPCRNFLLDPILSGLEEGAEWEADPFPNLKPAGDGADAAAFLLDEVKEEIKVEPDFPPSPPPSSAGSTSSLCNAESWSGDGAVPVQDEAKTVLEVQPLSPPFSDNSPPESPQVLTEHPQNAGNVKLLTSPNASPPTPPETVVKIIPYGLKLKAGKQLTIAQRPAPFIKPKPCTEQPQVENSVPTVIKTAVPTVKSTLPNSAPNLGDRRKTLVLSAKDFAALTQKVRENQVACTLGIINGVKGVPTTLRLQAPKNNAPPTSAPAAVPQTSVTSSRQTSTSTFAQVLTPSSVPGKVPLIPYQTITNTVPTVTALPVTTSSARPLQTTSFPSQKTSQNPVRREMELKAIKRQQRMIKNRESACLSRKKKKEYVSSLEGRLSELEQENVQLKLENEALRERLSELENSMSWTKSPTFVKTKKATAILVVLLMVSFNFGSFSSMISRPTDPLSVGKLSPSGSPEVHGYFARHGRSLLWAASVDMTSNDTSSDYLPKNSSARQSTQPICPLYINQTESIRLDSELRRWIRSDLDYPHDSPKRPAWHIQATNNSSNALFKKSGAKSPEAADKTPTPSSGSRDEIKEKRSILRRKSLANRASKKSPSASNEVEVYGIRTPLYDYTAFLDSFQRRDDTFYVVSFSGDHILLPAQAQNSSLRPKMSLVLPAVPISKSMFGPNHIRMMQIDCEVTNTQMLRVRQDDIPAHFRPSSFERFSNVSSENGRADAANDSSSSPGSAPNNVASSLSSSSSQSFQNSSQTGQSPSSSAQPIYKPYFMKTGYPEKHNLSPPYPQKLNTAFLGSRSVDVQGHNSNSSHAVRSKPLKIDAYP